MSAKKRRPTGSRVAGGTVRMEPATLALIREGRAAKGDVLGVAQVAAIMAAKRDPRVDPDVPPAAADGDQLRLRLRRGWPSIEITARVETRGQTGVEMEALTAVSVAALTIYDMVKAVDRAMTIEDVRLLYKSGGKSGTFERDAAGISAAALNCCAMPTPERRIPEHGKESPMTDPDARTYRR